MRIALLFVFILLIPTLVSGYELNVKLVINGTNNNVYVPGRGELSNFGEAVYTNTPHFFVASYLGSLMGIASAGGSSIAVNKTANTHSIQLNSNMGSLVFIILSKGDWKDIDKRIGLIETGKFLSEIKPSFSFGLGTEYAIKMILSYAFNVTGGSAQKGIHNIIVENTGNEVRLKM